MNKYVLMLITALSLTLVSGQSFAYRCYSWWEGDVKYSKCYREGYRHRDRDRDRHHHERRGDRFHEHERHHGRHGSHHHGHHRH